MHSVSTRLMRALLLAGVAACIALPALPAAAEVQAEQAQGEQAQSRRGGFTMRDAITGLLETSKRMQASVAEMNAAGEMVGVERGNWFPKFDMTAYSGHERHKKGKGVRDTSLAARNLDVSLTQLIWDFGATMDGIKRSQLSLEQARQSYEATRQTVMLEGVTVYLQVLKAKKQVDSARASVANIKRQTELENALVERGSGFRTDVLQAKRALAGAEARRTRAEGALQNAINRYRRLYEADPDMERMRDPKPPFALLPESRDAVVAEAMEKNAQLKAAYLTARVAEVTIDKTRADEFFPVINGVASSKWKNGDGGTEGGKTEQMLKVEMTYDFNLGLTAVNTLKASEQRHMAAAARAAHARNQVEEVANNGWDDLLTARTTAGHLRNQANIAGEFLENARKERQLGNRTLLDVLTGETEFINATSDALSAEMDVAVALYTLLGVMGRLDVDVIE